MPVVTNVEDLRQLAKKRVAKAIFDYVDRGSYDEATLRANRADLEALTLRQRVAIDVEDRKSTRLNSSHITSSYAVFCLKKKKHRLRATPPPREFDSKQFRPRR